MIPFSVTGCNAAGGLRKTIRQVRSAFFSSLFNFSQHAESCLFWIGGDNEGGGGRRKLKAACSIYVDDLWLLSGRSSRNRTIWCLWWWLDFTTNHTRLSGCYGWQLGGCGGREGFAKGPRELPMKWFTWLDATPFMPGLFVVTWQQWGGGRQYYHLSQNYGRGERGQTTHDMLWPVLINFYLLELQAWIVSSFVD